MEEVYEDPEFIAWSAARDAEDDAAILAWLESEGPMEGVSLDDEHE